VWHHQLGSGALMLFAFFMISDPMTIPNDARGRILYAILVAAIAFAWTFVAFRPNALPWALFLATPLVPWIDRIWRAPRFEWRTDGPAAARR
jgi:Na+-translocating ferredoxin:NAD+ oxidoreductase RnfD subunit